MGCSPCAERAAQRKAAREAAAAGRPAPSGGSGKFEVKLPGGLKVIKTSELAAKTFAERHPGSTWRKVA